MPSARDKWQLYPRNQSKNLDARLFRRPTAEYRGTPFWSWNNKLAFPQLRRQIDQFRQMGFGGVHIHSRTGLATEYLGKEFMSLVSKCHGHLKRRGMLTWLYDEDRWPSGFAGGLVSRAARFRERTLLWTTRHDDRLGTPLASYAVELQAGRLKSFRRLLPPEAAQRDAWRVYLRTAAPDSWFNHQTYIDTFNRAAVERFIAVTHERYRKSVGRGFGTSIPSIFTDEPHFTKKQTFATAGQRVDVVLPFSDDFCQSYRRAFNADLLDSLPELFWDRSDGEPSRARYRYHEHTAERFASSFGDTIARWCKKNHLALTGHMLSEATLFGQSRAVGEVMRGLRSFQLPGIDMLEDKIELTTAKQAQSVARQHGRPGVLSELYGVTNWDFDFAGHKRQGDWQAALGVTVRVPHLAWVSMAGESKRDYPAAIGYQSPWFREYKLVEDHFARLATVLTRGRPLVRVAVIHPIESFWLHFGPADQNQAIWKQREQEFKDLTAWLTFGAIDFDFISEASLPSHSARRARGGTFAVGRMKYAAVIVPNLLTIRSTTLDHLRRFVGAGGTVIFAGNVPSLVDARSSHDASSFAKRCHRVSFNPAPILAAVEQFREVQITRADGTPADAIAHQIRVDGKARFAFFCNTDRNSPAGDLVITVNGRWAVDQLDTFTGTTAPAAATIGRDRTTIAWHCHAHDHLLLRLTPATAGRPDSNPAPPTPGRRTAQNFSSVSASRVPITLSEPNVLLLDQAEWKLDDDEQWQPAEEILRLDNLARRRLNLPTRGGRDAQPWTDTAPDPVAGTLHLRFTIRTAVAVKSPLLAIEEPRRTTVRLDGKRVPCKSIGWWVDESIKTIRLPSLANGRHTLEISIPMRRRSNVEWCYVLGDFGVRVAGRRATVIAAPKSLTFGDWTQQGLPFYAGNVTYHVPITGDGRAITLRAAHFRNPLLTAAVNGRRVGSIAFAPYELPLDRFKGRRIVQITAFGNRHNAFGPLHHTKRDLTWVGPAAWRSDGQWWSYDYQFKPIGLMKPPELLTDSDRT